MVKHRILRSALGGLLVLIGLWSNACRPTAQLDAAATAALIQPTTTAVTATATWPPATLPPPTSTAAPTATTTATPTATQPPEIELLFTGIIVPARCVQAALDANGNPDHPYEEVRDILQAADLTIGTFNATMSARAEHTGCTDTYQLVGSPENADALQRAGFDVMSVATNHIKDCGPRVGWCAENFFDTLDNLRRVDILPVGAGKNLAEALQPVVVTVQGVRFGFVSLGDSKMDMSVFAGLEHPGIAHLDAANVQTAVDAARAVSDVVVALPHWGSEDNFTPNWNQQVQAQQLVAAGADLIVGNHTHVVQAIKAVAGTPVFYGLGNFVFDQGLRDHRQSVILRVKFTGTRYTGYELIPVYHDRDGRVHLAGPDEAQVILENIERAGAPLP